MGAWSHHAFGNDTALDWAAGLDEVVDLSSLHRTIEAALADAPELDADLACEALAAIEVVAALRGHPASDCPDAVQDWVARLRLAPPAPLLEKAQSALARIAGPDSELRALWEESEQATAWRAALDELGGRIRARPQPLAPRPDAVARLLARLRALPLAVPPEPAPGAGPALRQPLYAIVLAAEALGEVARLRSAVARLWPLLSGAADLKLQWDLAVREAKTWAAEGRLDAALAGLAPWKEAAESLGPGTFAMRCMSVCQEGGDHEAVERLREELIAAGPGATLQLLDRALMLARTGSAEAAEDLLHRHAEAFSAPGLAAWRDFAGGILATRAGQPAGLDVLTTWLDERLTQAQAGPAVWPFLGIGAGWWALALQQAGRSDEARAALAAIAPLLPLPSNALLAAQIQAAGLPAPALRTLPLPPSPAAEAPGMQADHGIFRTVSVRGVNAMAHLHALRAAFAAGSRLYPLLVGDANDLAALLDSLDPPVDGGQATLAAAQALDPATWLRDRSPARLPRWRASEEPPAAPLQTLIDLRTGHLKPLVHLALIELRDPGELFARLGWGGWNGCPEPAVHVALQRHWRERFGAEPVALTDAVLECTVARPPGDRQAALQLAVEQRAYCDDIVEQGVGSTPALAARLLGAAQWYFWWD